VVKLAGAAYLIYLGVSTLFSLRNKLAVEVMAAGIPLPYRKIFLQAVLVNALNHKYSYRLLDKSILHDSSSK
jgi:threonine/homoserine/homoserine lactone efflux protein